MEMIIPARVLAAGMARRIRQIARAREALENEPVPAEFELPSAAAIEHLRFLQADLQHDLDNFCIKYRLGSISAGPAVSKAHKGVR